MGRRDGWRERGKDGEREGEGVEASLTTLQVPGAENVHNHGVGRAEMRRNAGREGGREGARKCTLQLSRSRVRRMLTTIA